MMGFALIALYCASSANPSTATSGGEARPNILFIAVDDLRPEFGAYGAVHIQSPHLDRLADESLLFTRAYCMVATCGASRASMFTSVRPTPERFVNFQTRADHDAPWATPWNTHFKNHGYHTISLGKIYHEPGDNAEGWSQAPWRSDRPTFHDPAKMPAPGTNERGDSTESADVPDDFYGDGALAEQAVAELRKRAEFPDQPFLLAVGFRKPHLPFVAPKKYWDLYPPESIHLPDNYFIPKNAPKESLHNFGELRNYKDIPRKGPLDDEKARHLIRGYYACVSYTDAQIGKVLAELDRLNLTGHTIIVLWGDHGWNLGDHTLWCKHSTYESSLHIPLLVKAPGFTTGGTTTNGLTESIDIYPSLCELAGLPVPSTVEGKSFVPLLRIPDRPWAQSATSRFRAGDSIRTERYRYSEYRDEDGTFQARMLYDHDADPLENTNIVDQAELEATATELARKLKQAIRATQSR